MPDRDTSSVFQKEVLDEEHQKIFPKFMDWAFETDGGISFFSTEAEACQMQRIWRRAHGYHEMTGEPVKTA